MRKSLCCALAVFLLIITVFCIILTSCEAHKGYGNYEYEVISVEKYSIITGKDKNGPKKEDRLVFVYMDNGTPELIKNYHEDDSPSYGKYILIGEANKYVVVEGYRSRDQYLYLTQETYNRLFPNNIV